MSPVPFNHVRSALPSNSTVGEAAINVVCAFPVSGQYGPGSRVLYYVVVALAILGRKVETLRNAALAVALVFPAVAALHAIVLAAVHVNDVVDMDMYGAFQLCSIGILAAPTSIRLSKTYKKARARGIMFLWTWLMVAGLLCLVVEFYRVTTTPCPYDDHGSPISRIAREFPYRRAMCGLRCSEETGPFSPMRGGAASNVYVIPEPHRLTFNTAMVIAAGCCIPAILSIAFTSIQDLEHHWKRRVRARNSLEDDAKADDDIIPGTNDATPRQMRDVQKKIRKYQYYIEVPLFSTAVLAILIIGELNFFSFQVNYETEPIASIGQWGPIAGTVLAAFGTLYYILATELDEKLESVPEVPSDHPRASEGSNSMELTSTLTNTNIAVGIARVGSTITNFTDRVSTATHRRLDHSDFKTGPSRGFPTVPGEENRNPDLPRIQEAYYKVEEDDTTARARSRAPSFVSFSGSGLGISGTDTGPSGSGGQGSSSPPQSGRRSTLDRSPSPKSPGAGPSRTSPRNRSPSPISPKAAVRRSTIDTCPSPTSPVSLRRNTLEVPPLVHHRT